jgi:hypothetical protein
MISSVHLNPLENILFEKLRLFKYRFRVNITFAFKFKHESLLGHFTNLNKHFDSCSLCVKYNFIE